MPYCEPCARHWTPSSMNADGSCPTCGEVLPTPKLAAAAKERHDSRPAPKAPWHFKLLLGSLVVYLGWRAYQGLEWLVGRI